MVVIDGTDEHHDLFGACLALQSIIVDGGIRTYRGVGMHRFAKPAPTTAETDVFVLYTAGGQLGGHEQEALSDAVAGGKGLVAVHASNVFPSDGSIGSTNQGRFELIGSRYLSHGPGASEGRFEVEILTDHEITAGVPNFEIDDEYYVIEMYDTSARILARQDGPAGMLPILYVRSYGKGRVCYLSLGHDMRAWGNHSFRRILQQSVRWAAGPAMAKTTGKEGR
jgi:type 1 glutamine amidotransferase